ncbi:MAG: PIN domain-containing protein [Planctomycetota bacterium]|nr:MAG: PIN domain-containing protein [Planctomycetota bacterium]
MRLRIYVDTSVFGGCEDVEFLKPSRRLVNAMATGEYVCVISEVTLLELENAPAPVREHLERIPESLIEVLPLDAEAEALATEYIRDGAVGKHQRADALHIAIATAARIDVLVSWNFKHIVNLRRIHAFNAVNLKRGYPILEIRNPREVIGDE